LTEEPKHVCDFCKKKEAEHLQYELNQCQKTNKVQNQKIQKLDRKVFILMCCVVAIGAVFGKETLDSLIEWLQTINSVKTQVDDLTASNIPGPGALLLLACAPLAVRPRRK
jgi:preprotein translocase subunit SecY